MLAARQQQRIDQPVRGTACRLMRSSSALMKLMSNEALWITSGASPMKARNSSTTSVNSGLLGQELGRQAVHGERFRRHVAFGIDVDVKGLARRHAVEDLDAADFDQPVAAQRIEASGFGIENDFAHDVKESEIQRRIRRAASAS